MRGSGLVGLAIRNTTRRPTRTLLTAGMVVAGTALLVLARSWIDGVFDDALELGTNSIGHVRISTPGYAARDSLMPLHENMATTDPVLAAIRAVPGVEGAYARIVTGATITVGEEIGDVFGGVVGASREWFVDRLDADASVVEGRWWEEGAEELVMGATLAKKAGAKLGDEVVVLGATQDGSISPIKGRLVGITRAGNALIDRQVFVPLDKARWLADIPDGATEILVYGADRDGAAELSVALAAAPGVGPLAATPWSEREPWKGMLGTVRAVQGVMVFIVVFLAGLGVWNTMMMSVLERTREVGVLRAMGMTRSRTVLLLVGEALAIAVTGGVVGVGLGLLPAWWLSHHGLHVGEKLSSSMGADLPVQTTMYARISLSNILGSFALGLVMALFGSALPALRASRIQPVEAMREGR